ncbi:MAG: hypothetical protein JSS30_06180 [Verrucomicrobia bacterium]|nr:hypothetical protein [Verrucomicrobiota bacterium]
MYTSPIGSTQNFSAPINTYEAEVPEEIQKTPEKKRTLESTKTTFESKVASSPLPNKQNDSVKPLKKRATLENPLNEANEASATPQVQHIQSGNPSAQVPSKPKAVRVTTSERKLEDGTILKGKFRGDNFISGTRTDKNGTIHRGYFKNNKLNGTGTKEYPGGKQEIGEYKDGILVGIIF